MSLMSESPIMSLPPEILSDIFAECMNIARAWPSNRDPSTVLLALASVCRTWRQAACSTSELWSTCYLNYKRVEHNSSWLAHAGGQCLLDLNGVSCPQKTLGFRESSLDQFLDSIIPFMPRCRSLRINAEYFAKNEPAEPRELDISFLVSVEYRGVACPKWFEAVLRGGAPNLRDLDLSIWAHNLPVLLGDIVFNNLTRLELSTTVSAAQVHRIMENVPKLNFLKLRGTVDRGAGHDTSVTHRSLDYLWLWVTGMSQAAMILDSVVLPSLQTLRLKLHHGQFDDEGFRVLIAFLQRSQCALQRLGIETYYISPFSFPLLQHWTVSPSLEVLWSKYTPLDESFFTFMSDPSNLPHLRILRCGGMYKECVPMFIEMLRARGRPNGGGQLQERSYLKRVTFERGLYALQKGSQDFTESVEGILAAAKGHDVTIKFPEGYLKEDY